MHSVYRRKGNLILSHIGKVGEQRQLVQQEKGQYIALQYIVLKLLYHLGLAVKCIALHAHLCHPKEKQAEDNGGRNPKNRPKYSIFFK